MIPGMIEQPVAYRRLYKNHGTSVGYWEGWVEAGTVIVQYAKLLDGKVTRRKYEAEAKNIGRSNETTPLMQAQLELDSLTNKKLDKGYVHKQEDASQPSTNTLGLKAPMLATPFENVKPDKIEWWNAFAQPKLDGHRALWKDGVLYSRGGKPIDLPHIVDAINASDLGHLHLDGELYIHGKPLQEISRLIKKQRPESVGIEYHLYDQILDKPFAHRLFNLQLSATDWAESSIRLVPTHEVSCEEDLLEMHAKFREQGYEGTMLRFSADPYKDGKRSRTLLKLKEFQDAEFTIVGVNEGKPYVTEHMTYRVPVWVCDVGNGETFTVTAQGNMHEKDELWAIRDQCIGKQLTVKFHYLSEAAIPQLPTALRFREDV